MPAELVNYNGIEMKYGKIGQGDKILVVLPGIYLKSIADLASSLETQFNAFLKDYTLYFFDRRTNSPKGYTLKDMSLDTATIIRHIGIKKADFYGVSQGGMMALYLAVFAKDIVNKVCVVSSAVKLDDNSRRIFTTWSKYAKNREIEKLVRSFVEYVYSEEFVLANEEALVEAFKDTSEKELDDFIINDESLATIDLEKYLDKIECPLFVMATSDERIFGIKAIDDLVKTTGCKYHYYTNNEPHAVYDESPDVLCRLENFLNEF